MFFNASISAYRDDPMEEAAQSSPVKKGKGKKKESVPEYRFEVLPYIQSERDVDFSQLRIDHKMQYGQIPKINLEHVEPHGVSEGEPTCEGGTKDVG